MSFQALSTVWGPDFPDTCKGVGRAAVRLTALAVADIVNDVHHNEFYGALGNLAAKTGLSKDTVRVAMQHLVEVGVLSIVKTDPGRPTVYRWHLGLHIPSGDSNDTQQGYPPGCPPGRSQGSAAGTRRRSGGTTGEAPRGTPGDVPAQTQENPSDTNPVVNNGPEPTEPTTLALVPPEPSLTPAQRANAIVRAYWDWCVQRYGRKPDIKPIAFQTIVTGLIKDGVEERAIKGAVRTLHEQGRPITRATIGAQIDGRGPRAPRQDVAAASAGLVFDDSGRLVGP